MMADRRERDEQGEDSDRDTFDTHSTDVFPSCFSNNGAIIRPSNRNSSTNQTSATASNQRQNMEKDKKGTKRSTFAGSKLKNSFDSFAEDTTLHGLRNVCSGQSPILRKVVWLVLLFLMAGTYFYIGSISVIKYFKKDSITKVTKKSVSELKFPAVSICDQNLFSRSIVEQYNGLSDWIPQFHLHKIDDLSPAELENATRILNQARIIDLVYGSSLRTFSLGRIFLSCSFNGRPFHCAENFKPLMTESAMCYTFQSEQKVEEDGHLYSVRPGFPHGLDLTINLDVDENYVTAASGLGVKVLVHDPYTYPRIEEQAFAVQPGVEAYVAIDQIRRLDLGPPYSNVKCHGQADSFTFKHVKQVKYNFEGCMINCMYGYAFIGCNCTFTTDADSCTLAQYYSCVRPQFEEYYKRGCGCLHPCKATTYDYRLSTLQYPTPMALHKAELEGWVYRNHTDISTNMLRLYVYYRSMQKTIIEQIPAYTLDELIANIGGQLGLFLGASIITLLELFEFAFLIAIKQCFRAGEDKRQVTPVKVNPVNTNKLFQAQKY